MLSREQAVVELLVEVEVGWGTERELFGRA
jgi:hypothetical protein